MWFLLVRRRVGSGGRLTGDNGRTPPDRRLCTFARNPRRYRLRTRRPWRCQETGRLRTIATPAGPRRMLGPASPLDRWARSRLLLRLADPKLGWGRSETGER